MMRKFKMVQTEVPFVAVRIGALVSLGGVWRKIRIRAGRVLTPEKASPRKAGRR